jgi:hypothetical protein
VVEVAEGEFGAGGVGAEEVLFGALVHFLMERGRLNPTPAISPRSVDLA